MPPYEVRHTRFSCEDSTAAVTHSKASHFMVKFYEASHTRAVTHPTRLEQDDEANQFGEVAKMRSLTRIARS